MQINMPESDVAAINALYAVAHEHEYLRSAAIDLIRAGLPADVVADIRDLARIRRRECALMRCCADPRYVLSVHVHTIRIDVTILAGTYVAAAFKFDPSTCAIVCHTRRAVHKGHLKNMSEAFRDAALTLLEIGLHFATGHHFENSVIRDMIGFIRDAHYPPSEWWVRWGLSRDAIILAQICDNEVVVTGCNRCNACKTRCTPELACDEGVRKLP